MHASLWSDPGTWIALGISALFLVVGWAMHRVFVKVLKAPPPDLPADAGGSPSSNKADTAHTGPPSNESQTP